MRSTTVQSEQLPLALQQQIDACCDRFESALLNGQKPEIGEFLDGIPPEGQLALRRELAAIEMAYQRTRVGHDTEGLHLRCPHCQNDVELLPEAKLEEITCNSCGDTFSLIDEEDVTLVDSGPRRVGHFELLERLGTGGFGSVWEARDTELDRLVALKLPRKSQLLAHEAEQFFREARTAAQLKHPHIVPVHEVGKEDGTIFIVTDLIRGTTMSDWLKQVRPSARETAELCATIAEALAYAHSRGVIHRDLKPSNVMLDEQHQPYIMDFGLAKRELGEITMTVDGTVLGTPAYMSPEQAQGKLHWIDRRTDIYSLGVMLFQMLTGELPYRGTAQQQIQQRIVDDAPDPRKLNPHAPADLATISLKCLEREATKRFANAEAVADELRRYLAGEPIRSRPISTVNRAFRWAKRNPALAAASALTVVLAIGGPLSALKMLRDNRTITAKQIELNGVIDEQTQRNNELRVDLGKTQEKLASILEAHPGIEDLSYWYRRVLLEFVESNQSSRTRLLQQPPTTDESQLLRQARAHLGWTYLLNAVDEHQEAITHAKASRELLNKLVQRSPDSVLLQLQLAECLAELYESQLALGEKDKARESLATALEMRNSLVQQHPDVLEYQLDQLRTSGMHLGLIKTVSDIDTRKSALQDWQAFKNELSKKLTVDAEDFYSLACYLTQHRALLPTDLSTVTTGHIPEENKVD